MIEPLTRTLVEYSQLAIGPVHAVLCVGLLRLALQAGEMFREGIDRWRHRRSWDAFVRALRERTADPSDWRRSGYSSLHRWVNERTRTIDDLDLILPEAEAWVQRRLGALQVWIRTGPMFGLIGTLAPLGPALDGLATSDLRTLSENLSVAFTTTILGIAIGAAAYWLYVIRRGWSERDLIELEGIAARAAGHRAPGRGMAENAS
ncbi:MAG TPA: hypothetical protein DCQ98_01490 [Planctomycetaceae bacterium]|nr:hypothetical protein [Planctomycetaceae bacterium]HRE99622.1 MotA/TolQ/ExbB proton channel family protein [Pirellulaceae bacterium]